MLNNSRLSFGVLFLSSLIRLSITPLGLCLGFKLPASQLDEWGIPEGDTCCLVGERILQHLPTRKIKSLLVRRGNIYKFWGLGGPMEPKIPKDILPDVFIPCIRVPGPTLLKHLCSSVTLTTKPCVCSLAGYVPPLQKIRAYLLAVRKSLWCFQLALNYLLTILQFPIIPCRTSIELSNNRPSGYLVPQIISEILSNWASNCTRTHILLRIRFSSPSKQRASQSPNPILVPVCSDPSQLPWTNLRPPRSRCQDEIRHAGVIWG